MAKFVHFTDEQKRRANSVNLEELLRYQGEELLRCGQAYRWKRHPSVSIRGNEWYRHSAEEGGHAIDFVRHFYNLNFPDAVTMLLNGETGTAWSQADREAKQIQKPFALPEKHHNARRVYAYLMKQRGIDADVISHFVRKGTLYEDAQYHNAVFVGVDTDGTARHAHKRSTSSVGKPFRINVESSDARFGFGHIGTSDRLYVFEAPIDMLSFISMYKKDWQQHSYLILNGVADRALLHTLETHEHLRTPILCLDNDEAGISATNRITTKLKELGYTQVSQLLPVCKDWNEQLVSKNIIQVEMQFGGM